MSTVADEEDDLGRFFEGSSFGEEDFFDDVKPGSDAMKEGTSAVTAPGATATPKEGTSAVTAPGATATPKEETSVSKLTPKDETSAPATPGATPSSTATAATPPTISTTAPTTTPASAESSSSNWRQLLFNGPSLSLTKHGPIYLMAFFLVSSVIYGDLRGYMLVSMIMLGLIFAYTSMNILDWLLRQAMKLLSVRPVELNSKQNISCLSLEFGSYTVGHKVNLSLFIYIFSLVYLLICANSQYLNSKQMLPKFTTFIVFFIFLVIHTFYMSVFRVCSTEDIQKVLNPEPPIATQQPAETGTTLSLTATVVYYNILTMLIALIAGVTGAQIVLKSASPELIYFHPKNEADVCQRNDRTEYTCDITPA